jgi:hypothetical protein
MAGLKSSFPSCVALGSYRPPQGATRGENKAALQRVALLREMQRSLFNRLIDPRCTLARLQRKCNAHLAALQTILKKGLCNAKCNALELNHSRK